MGGEKRAMAHKISPAEMEKYLKGLDYPVTKADMVKRVQQEMQQVLAVLQRLPDQTYQKPTDVAKALGEIEASKGQTR